MQRDIRFGLTIAAVLAAAAACRAPVSQDDVQGPPRTSAVVAHKPSPEKVAMLEKLVGLERQMLANAERTLRSLRDLHSAGRQSGADLAAAELDLIRRTQALLIREQELADAQHGPSRKRRIASLRELVDLDLRAVEMASRLQAQEQELFNAGRRQQSDLAAAKGVVLRCHQTLRDRRRDLADAQAAR